MEWKITPGLTDYASALAAMEARVKAIQAGEAEELVWLVEHPPIYTLGTSAKGEDVLHRKHSDCCVPGVSGTIPTYQTGRGGQVTYHGPGQRVVYLMLDLKKRAALKEMQPDLRAYVHDLERWTIATLGAFGIEGFTREGRVGVWVDQGTEGQSTEKKIAALGVRVQKWVTSHGIALNVNPDLSHYEGIVPCGIREFGVTSMHALGVTVAMEEVDGALKRRWGEVWG